MLPRWSHRTVGAFGLVFGAAVLFGASAPPAQAACAAGFVQAGTACQAQLGFTGSPVKLEVPAGVELTMRALGGSGGANASGFCGTGGYDSGELAVGVPETLTVEVGEIGETPGNSSPVGGAGGYGGGGHGGEGGATAVGGGGGGGGTYILGPSGKPLLVAGGGGGAGSVFLGNWGGVAGFPGGEPLDPPFCSQLETELGVFKQVPAGQPGQPAAGGAGGSSGAGAGKGPAVGVGVFGDGGDGAESAEGGGGGGGGGYYGGGGGGGGGWEVNSETTGGGAGGGGGEGFISPCLTNPTSRSPQDALDNGFAELSYAPGAGAAAQAAGGCEGQLKVFIKIVGPIANVGTRSGLAVNDDDHKDGPVHFTVPIGSTTETEYTEANEAGQKCESGCANLLVTVINQKTGKPAANATVNAALGQIDTAGSPNLHQIGSQFLCLQSDSPSSASCGTELHGLTANANGHVHLLYWAPGELVSAHSILTVTASSCASPCSGERQEGSEISTLNVEPYRIYDHQHGELSRDEVKALIAAVDEPKLLELLLGAAHHKVFESALEWLGERELLSEHLVRAAAGPLGYAIVGAGELLKTLAEGLKGIEEQEALATALLHSVKLSPEGIGVDPFEHHVPAGISNPFQHLILNDLGLPLARGMLWDLGKALAEQYKTHKALAVQEEHVGVSVYETSTCTSGRFDCGPGYGASLTGMRPSLCFDFTFTNRVPDGDFEQVACLPYNPVAWVLSQKNGLNRAQP